jgi:hypothetical protein
MIWNDINIFKRDYSNGVKKLDGDTDMQIEKLKHKTNAFNITPDIDEHGLDDKYTIRPFKIHYDQSLKNLFKNKCTPSNSLNGKVNLSTGTKEILKMTNKMIPKVDHSGVDPGYYEHKLNEIKSNKDLMMKEYSKANTFAKDYVERMKRQGNDKTNIMAQIRTQNNPTQINPIEGGGEIVEPEPFLPIENHPSKSTARNKIQLPGKGLDISPIKQSDESRLENNFTQAWDEMDDELNNLSTQEKKDNERIKLKQKRGEKIREMALKNVKNKQNEKLVEGAREIKEGRQKVNKAASKITKFISNIAEKKKSQRKSATESDFDEEEPEEEVEETEPNTKKPNKTKEARELATKLPPLTPLQLQTVITNIDKDIKHLKKFQNDQKIDKDYTNELNEGLREYGLINVFRANTSVRTVKKRLNDYRTEFDTSLTIAKTKAKLGGLSEAPQIKKSEDKKKAESI